jgi:AcrR family transcriptional regulator
MGRRHSKEEILAGALDMAFEDGLSQLTFGRVAKHLGINDRTIVYYFPSKDDLISEVMISMGLQLQATLAPAFATKRPDHLALVRSAWPMLATDEADPVFALFFEAAGLAAVGREPYRQLVPFIMDAWITWSADFVDGPPKRRRAQAEAAVALLDGLLFLRQTGGPEAADRAARALGVR